MNFWKRFIYFYEKKNIIKQRIVFLKLLLSYLLVLVLPIIIGTFLLNKIESIMVDDANRSNTAMLDQVRQVMDNRLKEIERLAMQISINPKLEWLMENNEPGNYKYIDLKNELARYQTVGTIINNFFVYLEESNVILSPAMKTNSDTFFNYIQQYGNITDKEMVQNRISGFHLNQYFPSEKVKWGQRDENMIMYLQSLPYGEKNDIKGALAILIDEQQIREMLNQEDWENKGSIYIIDESKETIMSTVKEETIITDLKPLLNKRENESFVVNKKDGQEMIVSYTTSNQNGWTYVSVVPKHIVLSKVNTVRTWAIYLVLCCFLIGIIVSYILANRNYRPIQELVTTILKGKNQSKEELSNEMDFIKQTVVSAINEQKQLTRIISQQAPVMKADLIARLVKGHANIRTITNKDLEFMGMHFKEEYYSVLIVQIDDCSQFVEENTETEWALIRFIISNLSEELLEDKGFTIQLERDQLAILNNHYDASKKSQSELAMFISKLKEIIETHFKTKITIAVSEIHFGMEEIPECYGEAVMALDYRLVKGQNSVIYYNDIKDVGGHNYHYPMETEVQLLNFAKGGDFENVEKLLNQVFKINIHSPDTTPEIGKCLSFDLLCTLFKLLGSLNEEDKKRFLDVENPLKIISKSCTLEEIQRNVKYLYQEFCFSVTESQTNHGERLYGKIVIYIEENYHDSMFSLRMMADHFGMNSSYLSSFFKKQSGQSITDFIAQKRVAESKKMLSDPKLTISEIAQRVGYANSVGLIRVFKKIEGIPPGKYRESI